MLSFEERQRLREAVSAALKEKLRPADYENAMSALDRSLRDRGVHIPLRDEALRRRQQRADQQL